MLGEENNIIPKNCAQLIILVIAVYISTAHELVYIRNTNDICIASQICTMCKQFLFIHWLMMTKENESE